MSHLVNPFVLIASVSLVLGLATGFVMHRSDFCMAGMFRDLFLFRRTVMLKSIILLVVATMVLFEVARQARLITVPFPLLYPPTAANFVAGLIFGIGMIFAGGCFLGTLYKTGAGSVLSLTAFLGLIVGSGLYAEVHPAWSAFAESTVLFPGKVTVAQILGVDPLIPVLAAAIPGLLLVFYWQRTGSMTRQSFAAGYVQPAKAALAIALISTASYILIGMPMGITSALTKIAGFFESILFRDHFEGLAFFKTMPLNTTHPFTGAVLQGGPGPAVDALSAIQFPLVFGIIAGSALSAGLLREFNVCWRLPFRQYVLAASGGILMGIASPMAPICNVWHLMGGVPILAASSLLFFLGIIPSVWIGCWLLVKALGQNDVDATCIK